nr:MAG TPA: hypothetical protein [Bacteriophage sp.]
MNQAAKEIIKEEADREYIESLTETLKLFKGYVERLSEQLEYLIEILE